MTEVVTVDPSRIEVRREGIGGLVVINAVLDRLCFDGLIDDHLPPVSARVALAPARAIGVLVRNLAIGRMPLHSMGSLTGRRATGPSCWACVQARRAFSPTTGSAVPWMSFSTPTGPP